jgi:hypothetical protein
LPIHFEQVVAIRKAKDEYLHRIPIWVFAFIPVKYKPRTNTVILLSPAYFIDESEVYCLMALKALFYASVAEQAAKETTAICVHHVFKQNIA